MEISYHYLLNHSSGFLTLGKRLRMKKLLFHAVAILITVVTPWFQWEVHYQISKCYHASLRVLFLLPNHFTSASSLPALMARITLSTPFSEGLSAVGQTVVLHRHLPSQWDMGGPIKPTESSSRRHRYRLTWTVFLIYSSTLLGR